MFNFTTTNVVNSLTDITTGKALISTVTDGILIKRVGIFKKANVEEIDKRVAKDPVMESVTITIPTVDAGTACRLNLYIGLTQASQDSRYSNDMIYKGKPFMVEFEATGTPADDAKNLVKIINKYQVLIYGDKQLEAEASGAAVTITAKTEFQRFKQVELEKFVPATNGGAYPYYTGTWTSLNPTVTKVAGVEGFGTYSYLLHNLRLPTCARTYAFAINQEESPIMGAKYNQYTIHYCVKRGQLGMNAVGDVVKSVTTHVFYVKSDLAAEFETELSKLGSLTEITGPTETKGE